MRQQPKSPLTWERGHQNRISGELIELGRGLCVAAKLQATSKNIIFLALTEKCLDTADAIRILCDAGNTDDSFALVRVLIEAVVTAAYLIDSDDQVADDYADYPAYITWKEFQGIENLGTEITADTLQEERERMRQDFEHVRARYEKTRGDWTADNIFERAAKIDERAHFNLFRYLINVGWRKSSAYVHSTAASIQPRLSEDQQQVNLGRKPAESEFASVLYASNIALFSLLAVVDIRTGKSRQADWEKLHERWTQGEPQQGAVGSRARVLA